MKKIAAMLTWCSLLFVASSTMAASENFGDYSVYYQAVNSTFINADIARQYGIVRSDRRAFLNISVLKNQADGSSIAVPAQLSGGKRNLLGQAGNIEFREIREGQAIYYIGEFDYSNAEIVRFRLEVSPEESELSHDIAWETRMYNN